MYTRTLTNRIPYRRLSKHITSYCCQNMVVQVEKNLQTRHLAMFGRSFNVPTLAPSSFDAPKRLRRLRRKLALALSHMRRPGSSIVLCLLLSERFLFYSKCVTSRATENTPLPDTFLRNKLPAVMYIRDRKSFLGYNQ